MKFCRVLLRMFFRDNPKTIMVHFKKWNVIFQYILLYQKTQVTKSIRWSTTWYSVRKKKKSEKIAEKILTSELFLEHRSQTMESGVAIIYNVITISLRSEKFNLGKKSRRQNPKLKSREAKPINFKLIIPSSS